MMERSKGATYTSFALRQIRAEDRDEIERLRAAMEAILKIAGTDRDGRTYYVLAQDALDKPPQQPSAETKEPAS